MSRYWWSLLPDLVRREIRNRLINTSSGWLWLIVSPLLLLGVYAFVFGYIFNARVPDNLDMPFIAWLAVALWPWLAFSESLLKGSQAILNNASLISKVALPRELLVLSSQSAVFLLHLFGYVVVLLTIQLTGTSLSWQGLGYAMLLLVSLYVFAVGLGLMLAAVQVFLRDLEQVLPTFLMFWFFMTPILYPPDLLPAVMADWMVLNPMSLWIAEIRASLFEGKWYPDAGFLPIVVLALLSLAAGRWLFNRLSQSFEDFL
ncbi:MAG: ABC transporter permease [Wenzhouxiangella sp.]